MRNGPSGGSSPIAIRERDRRLLVDLFLQRTMSRDHFIELGHFGSVPRCNNRLRKLMDHGYVQRHHPLARGSASQALYRIGPAAVDLVARKLDLDPAEVRPHSGRDVAPLFLEHTLGLVDLRILFEQDARRLCLPEFEWLPETLCRHEYAVRVGAGWTRHILRPDACACWNAPQGPICHFAELDLGNVSEGAFTRKVDSYRRYLGLGVFRETYGSPSFRVLTVTTGERRLRNLLGLCQGPVHPEFLFATFEAVKKSGPLGTSWAGSQGHMSLLGGAQ